MKSWVSVAIARQYMSVVMSPDAIGFHRLILAEGPRSRDLVESFYCVGPDRVTARLARALRTWARHGRICTVDAERIAMQFFDVVRGELHFRALAGRQTISALPSRATSIMPDGRSGVRSDREDRKI
ncbi:TetR/AcrR family transcriptional regulator C-terminal domain-containing protein [Bradyrhizobium genosp. P]|uniref:TetR/AcrR family transcriptional regulator C-terminal domain-containing protein n=1 Tax=Bradyrhizobium genosp. P TaxID=83641 RepID=UPI003CEF4254